MVELRSRTCNGTVRQIWQNVKHNSGRGSWIFHLKFRIPNPKILSLPRALSKPNLLLTGTTPMLPFLTALDPLGGGSIDPLGAFQTYGILTDLLLPGVTTITNRSRYLSMLCAALASAEKHHQPLSGASGLEQRRKSVGPFDRLWALACVAARETGHEGAADDLRGITYAEMSYRSFATNSKLVNCDFPLLKFQSRTCAVGTYWTALIGGQLVRADRTKAGAATLETRTAREH
jgi:hypothetical protein